MAVALVFDKVDKAVEKAIESVNNEKPEFVLITGDITHDGIQEQYEEGLLTDTERYAKVIELWTNTKEKVTDIRRYVSELEILDENSVPWLKYVKKFLKILV